MKIAIAVAMPMRRWQVRLADELRAAGHDVGLRPGPPRGSPGFGVDMALWLERRLFGPRSSLFERVDDNVGRLAEMADLVISLDGIGASGEACLEPLFGGATGDAALVAMTAAGGNSIFTVWATRGDIRTLDLAACLAVEDRDVLSRAIDAILARTITLLCHAVRRCERDVSADHTMLPGPEPSRAVLSAMAAGLLRKVGRRLRAGGREPQHWRIGFRWTDDPGVADRKRWPDQAFALFDHDGLRFQADPMPFEHDGRMYLFFENYPYATRKGVIDVIEIDESGSPGAPRTVLEEAFHLSYPMVIRHRGEIYMIPEMNAAARIQLFRADPFPDQWTPDRVLVDGIVAADTTPIFYEGIWWLFASVAGDGGSSWDQLALFSAPDLLGPWTPHRDNPVLVDAGSARPAGAMWIENGVLMRVAQDCRGGYGRALVLCRIDRLDAEAYRQTVVARLAPPAGSGAKGVHTLGRCGSFEVIDLLLP